MIGQMWTLLKLNLLSLPQRWASAAIDVFGVACIVAVFIGLFSIAASFRSLLMASADDGILMVLKTGQDSEDQSVLDDGCGCVRGEPCDHRRPGGDRFARERSLDQRQTHQAG